VTGEWHPALQARSNDGSLPLHAALENSASLEKIQFLADEFCPQGPARSEPRRVPPAARRGLRERIPRQDRAPGQPISVGAGSGDERGAPSVARGRRAQLVRGGRVPLSLPLSSGGEKGGRTRGWFPLHFAAAAAAAPTIRSLEVAQLLVDAHPEALRQKTTAPYDPFEDNDDLSLETPRGCLPLHVAALHHAPLDVVVSLARAWPEAIGGDGGPSNTQLSSKAAT
jgi:hypothetical protein